MFACRTLPGIPITPKSSAGFLRKLAKGQCPNTRIAATPEDMARSHWGNPSGYDPRWVYHGLLVGPPSDAVAFLRGAFSGAFLSAQSDDLPALSALLPCGLARDDVLDLGACVVVLRAGDQEAGRRGREGEVVALLLEEPEGDERVEERLCGARVGAGSLTGVILVGGPGGPGTSQSGALFSIPIGFDRATCHGEDALRNFGASGRRSCSRTGDGGL